MSSSSTFPHTKNNNTSILATRDPNTASPPPPALKGEKNQEQQQQQQLEEGLEVGSDPNIRERESREDGAKVQSMEFHRRVLRERLEEEKYGFLPSVPLVPSSGFFFFKFESLRGRKVRDMG